MGLNKPDPSKYHIEYNVPLVDTFQLERRGRNFDVDDGYLHELVANAYRREKSTGDYPVLYDGHSKDPNRKSYGFTKNHTVRKFGNTDRNAIYGDMWIEKDKLSEVKSLPRRSCEIAYDLKQLDGVALLGATSPERDLGMLHLSREIPEMNDDAQGMPKWAAEFMDKVLSAVMSLSKPAEPAMPAGGAPQGQPMSDEELQALIAELEGPGSDKGGEGKPEPKAEKKPKDEPKPKDEKLEMSREKELLTRIAALEADGIKSNLTLTLSRLKSEGVQIEVENEVKDLMQMDLESRKLMLSKIEKNYPRAPVGKGSDALAHAKGPDVNTELTEEKRKAIRVAALELGSYEAGYTKIMGKPVS